MRLTRPPRFDNAGAPGVATGDPAADAYVFERPVRFVDGPQRTVGVADVYRRGDAGDQAGLVRNENDFASSVYWGPVRRVAYAVGITTG